ncbi:unnamed protein product [Ceratitis capitata]|uniref:(Mediterranean fruit fly) hypothetical protein n=1 Tax=Ceratitis capitata TaxID=7213 RepID=A0A811UXU4_CERCA|nr:unnamed protein product [Ceratitis capitata]
MNALSPCGMRRFSLQSQRSASKHTFAELYTVLHATKATKQQCWVAHATHAIVQKAEPLRIAKHGVALLLHCTRTPPLPAELELSLAEIGLTKPESNANKRRNNGINNMKIGEVNMCRSLGLQMLQCSLERCQSRQRDQQQGERLFPKLATTIPRSETRSIKKSGVSHVPQLVYRHFPKVATTIPNRVHGDSSGIGVGTVINNRESEMSRNRGTKPELKLESKIRKSKIPKPKSLNLSNNTSSDNDKEGAESNHHHLNNNGNGIGIGNNCDNNDTNPTSEAV